MTKKQTQKSKIAFIMNATGNRVPKPLVTTMFKEVQDGRFRVFFSYTSQEK